MSFEQRMVVPASSAVFVAGLLTAWAQSRPIVGFLQGSGSNWLLLSLILFLSLMPIIILVLAPRRRALQLALDAAMRSGDVTPELRAALWNRFVLTARLYEWTVVLVILVLSFIKPFYAPVCSWTGRPTDSAPLAPDSQIQRYTTVLWAARSCICSIGTRPATDNRTREKAPQ